MKKLSVIALSVLAGVACTAANARDAVISPAFNWSGVYIGVHGGYLRGENEIPDFATLVKPDGGFAGFQFGYWAPLSHNWLYGFEADYSLSRADGTDNTTGTSSKIERFGTARTRIGYADGPWLIFASGGFAWARMSTDDIASPASPQSAKQSFIGWSGGIGAEYMIAPRWSARAEYIYASFDRNSENLFGSLTRQDLSFGTVRVGLNYRLNNMPIANSAAPRATFDWSGSYIGVHAGKASGSQTMTYLGGTVFFEPKGNFWGVQGGYNWQLPSNIVLGVESDISFASIDGSFMTGCCVTKTEQFGTVRARAGYALSNLLIYGTGGLAWAKPDNEYFFGASGSNRPFIGWAAGAGLEYALSQRWTIRGEYLHLKFAPTRSDYFGGFSGFDERGQYDIYRVGLNYRASLFDILAGR